MDLYKPFQEPRKQTKNSIDVEKIDPLKRGNYWIFSKFDCSIFLMRLKYSQDKQETYFHET